jgi:SAM-dependent methyltransferase
VTETIAHLVDPVTREPLRFQGDHLVSRGSGHVYRRNADGYFDFTPAGAWDDVETTSEAYAEDQNASWRRFYDEFLKPWVDREDATRVLEVGSGLGYGIRFLLEDGAEAYAIDIPCLTPFWKRLGNDPAHFLAADGAQMPFPDGFFDAVYSLGVIEHIGTRVGHYTLADDYQEQRQRFADELLRVTRPGGRLLITCPNKRFAVDIHHEPTDDATPEGAMRFRRWWFDRFGMTLHKPFGRYHLFSFGELRDLFCTRGGASAIRALPMANYFAFKRTGSLPLVGFAKAVITTYIEHMPGIIRRSPLNPFLVTEIRK